MIQSPVSKRNCDIRTWKKFARKVRPKGCGLLKKLPDFQDPVLVAGCQRSGTTILSRIITQSEGMVNYWFGRDDELDAALILSGYVEHEPVGRHCFQTTYLNECYKEYLDCKADYKLIWVLRSPHSVVYSMLYNWKRFALNELFAACGEKLLDEKVRMRSKTYGRWMISRLVKACYSYVGKVSQVFELNDALGDSRLLIIDYDEMVINKNRMLPMIYKYIGLPYRESYAEKLRASSLNKASRLSRRQASAIDEICLPIYEKARALCQGEGSV